MLDIQIKAKEGFAVAMENNLFTILDTNLTDELIIEGLAREFISKIQQMRKQNNFEMMDRIVISFVGNDKVKKAVDEYREYIMKETLADEVKYVNEDLENYDLNGNETGLKVEKV